MRPGTPAIHIRPARREDIPDLVTVNNSSVLDGEDLEFGGPRSARTFADGTRLSAAWGDPNDVRGETVFVAEAGGRVVAYVTGADNGEALELVTIHVRFDHQGRGIGTSLVRFIEQRARATGKRAVTLGTSRNASGVAWKSCPWWQHLGYRVTGEEENAWTRSVGPGVREIRMRKDLL